MIKGVSHDIQPTRPTFHVQTPEGKKATVQLADLKAVFYVRSLDGNSAHNEDLKPDPTDVRNRGSTVVTLRFHDRETIVGLSNASPVNRPFFFVSPVDVRSNNIRILVNQAALAGIEFPTWHPGELARAG
jgi:hypothetical protein